MSIFDQYICHKVQFFWDLKQFVTDVVNILFMYTEENSVKERSSTLTLGFSQVRSVYTELCL